MANITTSTFAKALWPGVNAWYGQSYKEYPVEWEQLFEKYSSTRNWEEDVGTSGFGLLSVKPEGAAVTYDSEKQGFTTRYSHTVYASGFVVTREAYEDDLYDIVAQRKSQSLAMSVRQTYETLGANVYNRAFNTSYLGGDGKELCNSVHPNIAGGTWSNIIGTAADVSEAALEQACIDIAGFTNDRGLKIAVMPQSILIPKEVEFDLTRILKNVDRPGTADRDINALNKLGKFPKGMIMNHYLTDTDAWFIRTNVPHGMKFFERRAPEFKPDNDFETENAKFKVTFRASFGWTDPRALYGSAGA